MKYMPFLLMLMTGCATVPTEQPLVAETQDPVQYKADLDFCRAVALRSSKALSLATISAKGAEGAAQNLTGAAVQPYVPVLGAAGSATSETLEEIGITDIYQQKIFIKCLDKKTERDGSALVVEPNP